MLKYARHQQQWLYQLKVVVISYLKGRLGIWSAAWRTPTISAGVLNLYVVFCAKLQLQLARILVIRQRPILPERVGANYSFWGRFYWHCRLD